MSYYKQQNWLIENYPPKLAFNNLKVILTQKTITKERF